MKTFVSSARTNDNVASLPKRPYKRRSESINFTIVSCFTVGDKKKKPNERSRLVIYKKNDDFAAKMMIYRAIFSSRGSVGSLCKRRGRSERETLYVYALLSRKWFIRSHADTLIVPLFGLHERFARHIFASSFVWNRVGCQDRIEWRISFGGRARLRNAPAILFSPCLKKIKNRSFSRVLSVWENNKENLRFSFLFLFLFTHTNYRFGDMIDFIAVARNSDSPLCYTLRTLSVS